MYYVDTDSDFALARVRELNDEARQYLADGKIVFSDVTPVFHPGITRVRGDF